MSTRIAKKKPPACDACKARRVLCHPQPPGSNIPCPRCAEKGVICKTTPVQRGRPRRELSELPSSSNALSLVAVHRHIERSEGPQLPPELVKDLIQCCVHMAGQRMPLFHYEKLKITLAAASWNLLLLPPQLRVLATCVCALSACISFNAAVIGPGPQPDSFTDRSTFFHGADLRAYGVRRAPFCRELYERAMDLACETRIHLEVSEDNAASCFFLDVLGRFNQSTITSRPWAAAYVSHARILIGSSSVPDPTKSAVWCGFMMAEALAAVMLRMPVGFTPLDQLLVTQSEPPSLEQLFQSLQAMRQPTKKLPNIVYTAVQPYMFHITRLARELHETIIGDYARRRPLAHTAVISFLSSLSTLRLIVSLVLDQLEFGPDTGLLFSDFLSHREDETLRACGFAVTTGFVALVFALHREMEQRIVTEARTIADDRWLQERTDVLRRQVREMTSFGVQVVARTIKLLPSLPHAAQLGWMNAVQEWADFYLTEVCNPGDTVDVTIFEALIAALKMGGYSRNMPRSSELIQQMEAYIVHHKASSVHLESNFSELFSLDDNTWTSNCAEMSLYYSPHATLV
ncbi:hypothetical protein C8R46DRAFT_69983 [Mycena filopes]|nr:hypothetical protein C8R46DRAFT_69983 [Mycena filopes]